jgi:hypothetical protein
MTERLATKNDYAACGMMSLVFLVASIVSFVAGWSVVVSMGLVCVSVIFNCTALILRNISKVGK